jgi:hypothetical protein
VLVDGVGRGGAHGVGLLGADAGHRVVVAAVASQEVPPYHLLRQQGGVQGLESAPGARGRPSEADDTSGQAAFGTCLVAFHEGGVQRRRTHRHLALDLRDVIRGLLGRG